MREVMRGGTEHTYHGDICRGINRVGHPATALGSLGNARKRKAGVPGKSLSPLRTHCAENHSSGVPEFHLECRLPFLQASAGW
jgi:hypothetical protein